MFCAALTSRSCRVPQDGHGHARVVKLGWRRQARVRFQATRTQPNVQFSMLACTWSGYARHLHAVLMMGNLIRHDPDL
jgi:hypothetical protein